MQLFLDLDGVLADFDGGVEMLLGKRPDGLLPQRMWPALAKAPSFYGKLEMMQDAPALWDFCKPFKPKILTGLPRGNWAEKQKRQWVASKLGRKVEVITVMSRDKHKYAAPGHVLVDDRLNLRDAWQAAGGTFIHHVSAARTIARLKKLGFGKETTREAGPRKVRPASAGARRVARART
jgi:hypothetical protein